MGCGTWTPSAWATYSTQAVKGKSTAQIYTSRGLKPEFDPKNVTRESRDSDDHPNSTPIIIGLDVTGSMDDILNKVAQELGNMVKEILDRQPVKDPQIMFCAVGDSMCDDVPLQVTQFESDIRIAEQLTGLYFERGGGGNGFESYPLAWYFAANHTSTDNFEKRGKKGILFTLGDDSYPKRLTAKEIKAIFGDDVDEDISVEEVLTQVNRKYEVYHLCLNDRWNSTYRTPYGDGITESWRKILGERAISVNDYTKVPQIIVSILEVLAGKEVDEVVSSWDGSTAMVVKNAIEGLTARKEDKELIEF